MTACPETLTDFCTMHDKIHGEGSAESAKAQLDWQCFHRARKAHKALKRHHKNNRSKDGSGGMVENVRQALSS